MSTRYYPAIIERGDLPEYGVFFPDLPGCTSAGNTLQQAARNAELAIRGHLALMVADGDTIPHPSDLDAIEIDPEVREAARLLVRVEVPDKAAA